MNLLLSFFESVTKTNPTVSEFNSLEELSGVFVDSLVEVEESEKQNSPLLCAVAEWILPTRSKKNIKRMSSVFIGDIDNATDAQFSSLLEALDGLSCVFYTTYNHGYQKNHCAAHNAFNRIRVILEFDREYPPEQHAKIWQAMNKRLLGLLDQQTKDPARMYTIPIARPGKKKETIIEYQQGEKIKIDELLKSEATNPPQNKTLTITEFGDVVSAWTTTRKESSKYRKEWAKKILAALEGKSIAEAGERDDALFRIACLIGETWPHANATEIASWFEASLQAMSPEGEHTVQTFADKIERAQSKLLEQETQHEQRLREELQSDLRVTLRDRDYPITEDEWETLNEYYDGRAQQHLILSRDRMNYILRPENKIAAVCTDNDLTIIARDYLKAFEPYVSLRYENGNGEIKDKQIPKIKHDYSTVIDDVLYDMCVDKSTYNMETKTLHLACAAPKVKPEFHDDINEFLLSLESDLLFDALAGLPQLDKMMPAIVLTGSRASGKTLLAHGIAGIYGSGPLGPDDVHTRFNSRLLFQPIVLHDESAGAAYASHGTSLVRQFTTSGDRYVEEKFRPKVRVKGFPRLIFAANNLHILDTSENMSEDDRDAFGERLLHIEMPNNSSAYLEKIRHKIQKEWLDEKHLAQHFLWLSKNHEIRNTGGRFLVEGPRTKLHDSLASGSGTSADVIYWLLSYLENPQKIEGGGDVPIQRGEGKLRVASRAVLEKWDNYLSTPTPRPNEIGRALSSISANGRTKVKIGGDRWVHCYEIKTNHLRAALDRHHMSEVDLEKSLRG